MYSLSALPVVATLAALVALPFSAPLAGTLLLAAALGAIFYADYVERHHRLRLPAQPTAVSTPDSSPSPRGEPNALAA